jgi:hypothetical protein
LRFSGESTAFDIGEVNASPAQSLLQDAVLFLEILDYVQLTAVDATGEHQDKQVKRHKKGRHGG